MLSAYFVAVLIVVVRRPGAPRLRDWARRYALGDDGLFRGGPAPRRRLRAERRRGEPAPRRQAPPRRCATSTTPGSARRCARAILDGLAPRLSRSCASRSSSMCAPPGRRRNCWSSLADEARRCTVASSVPNDVLRAPRTPDHENDVERAASRRRAAPPPTTPPQSSSRREVGASRWTTNDGAARWRGAVLRRRRVASIAVFGPAAARRRAPPSTSKGSTSPASGAGRASASRPATSRPCSRLEAHATRRRP